MATTYQDRKGKVFKNREDAKKSNQSMGTPVTTPKNNASTTVTKKTKASNALVNLSTTLANLPGGGGTKGKKTTIKQLSSTLANLPGGGANRSSGGANVATTTPAKSSAPGTGQTTSEAAGNVSTRKKTREEILGEAMTTAQGIQEQINKLREREKTAAADAIASDTSAVADEKKSQDKIKGAIDDSPTSRALELLKAQIEANKVNERENLKSINKDFNVQKTGLEGAQASETGVASVGLANAGGYLGFSGSGQGVMLKLAESHRAELTALEAKRQNAIQIAKNAAADRKFDIVKLQADEVARIDQEAADKEEKYNERVRLETEKETLKAEKMQTESDIFSAIQSGAKTPKDVFKALGGAVPIKDITDFLDSVTKGDEGAFKFSATQTAGLIGAGMGLDDIKALNEYVSANGYDANVKSLLTPAQKAAADKIFSLGTVGSGGDYDFTSQEKRKLEQAGLLRAPRQEQLDYLYGGKDTEMPYKSVYTGQILEGKTTIADLPLEIQEDTRKELYALGFATDAIPQWYQDYQEASNLQSVDAGSLQGNWDTFRKTALGESVVEEQDGSWWSKFTK